jgi:hypothetical protein
MNKWGTLQGARVQLSVNTLPSICEALGSIPDTTKQTRMKGTVINIVCGAMHRPECLCKPESVVTTTE